MKKPPENSDGFFAVALKPLLRQRFDVQIELEAAGLLNAEEQPMLMEAPFASGVPSVTVPDDQVELKAPPLGCDGGCSNVVPCTLTVQGVVA